MRRTGGEKDDKLEQIIEKERMREKIIVIFAYPLESIFKLQLRIRSPLDRANFWTTSFMRVILQIIWLNREKDI